MVGAATTFLGIMPLAFASNVIFRVFFKMFLIIITFGVSAVVDGAARSGRGACVVMVMVEGNGGG